MHRNFSFPLLHCYSAMDVLQMQMQHCTMCCLGSMFYLATKQAETYLKICVLIYHLTYICPSLFDYEVNIFFHFCEFHTLNLQFPPYYSPVSTTEFALQTRGYFGYRAIVLPKQHIVHCNIYQNNQDLSLPSGSDILPIY